MRFEHRLSLDRAILVCNIIAEPTERSETGNESLAGPPLIVAVCTAHISLAYPSVPTCMKQAPVYN